MDLGERLSIGRDPGIAVPPDLKPPWRLRIVNMYEALASIFLFGLTTVIDDSLKPESAPTHDLGASAAYWDVLSISNMPSNKENRKTLALRSSLATVLLYGLATQLGDSLREGHHARPW